MSETVNGVDCYVTDITGNVTKFIRVEGLTSTEKTFLDARETAAGSIAGYNVVDFGGVVVGGNATGLANDTTTYTATVTIDGSDNAVSVVGSASQTFTNLVSEINTDLTGATAAIDGDGNITITSDTAGNDSAVVIADTDLFASCTGFVAVNSAVKGNLQTDLAGQTYTSTGQNAWSRFGGFVESYDSASDRTVLGSDASTAAGANPTAAEFDAVVAKVNAMRDKFPSNKY